MEQNMYNPGPVDDLNMQSPEQGGKGLSVAGMVLGIVSIVCCGLIGIICGIVGLVLSIVALKNNRPGRGMAIAGLVCSAVGVVAGIIYLIFYATTLLPAFNFNLNKF